MASPGAGDGNEIDALLCRLLQLNELEAASGAQAAETEQVLDELAEAISGRRLDTMSYEDLYLEVTQIRSQPPATVVVTATGVAPDGLPDPVGFVVGSGANVEGLCRRLLQDLRGRGLRRVARIGGPPATGVSNLIPWLFPGAEWVELHRKDEPPWFKPDPGGPDERRP